MDIKETEFIKWLTESCRIRHYHCSSRNKVIEFAVQLEFKAKGLSSNKDKWRPIVRYDTAHDFAHKDIYHTDGRREKIPLGINDLNIAMTFAEEELKKEWNMHLQRFLKEVDDDE